MRILMTTDTVGGVWTFTQELATGLLEQGCDVALVSVGCLPGRQQQNWALEMKRRWGDGFCFRSVDTPLEWMLENDRAYTEAAPLLQHLAEDFEADLFHANQFCFGALPLSIPKVVTAHSDVLSWAGVCRRSPLEDSKWLEQYRSLVSEGLAAADAVVAPTCWMMDELSEHFDLPVKQRVIPNGRTLRPALKRPRKLQAVTAGRLWDEAKSIRTLSDVVSPIPLLIAGETRCERSTAPAAFGGAHLLGALSQEALLTLFRENAIYICPSQYEPFGLAPLEAALCGCAILANDISSLREVWDDGAVYFSGADGLSEILRAFHANPKLLAGAQERSFRQAQRYTRAAMTASYLASFQELAVRSRELSDVA